jgi:transcriptional regulator with XRE-family HTH domain
MEYHDMAARRKRWPQGAWMKLTSPDTLKALMDQRGFSYERLARYAGCSKSFVSHLVKGRKHSCSPLLAENIAEALEVPLALLFVPFESAGSGQSILTTRKAG